MGYRTLKLVLPTQTAQKVLENAMKFRAAIARLMLLRPLQVESHPQYTALVWGSSIVNRGIIRLEFLQTPRSKMIVWTVVSSLQLARLAELIGVQGTSFGLEKMWGNFSKLVG